MNFKEWLSLDEARFKGLKRMFMAQNPDMPKYVQNDLYNSRIAYPMDRQVHPEKIRPGIPYPSTQAQYSPSQILDRSGLKNDRWAKTPTILVGRSGQQGVTPADFTSSTQNHFINRKFGFNEMPSIPNDGNRTRLQQQMMNYRMPGTNEPVIVRKTPNGYELLEGWHRTMSMLLKGAPPDQMNTLRSGYIQDVNFDNWKPVLIKAYSTEGQDSQSLIGTGEYVPTGDVGTGEYNPTGPVAA